MRHVERRAGPGRLALSAPGPARVACQHRTAHHPVVRPSWRAPLWGEAASLWGWNSADPRATVASAYLKRVLDPVAAALVGAGLGMSVLAGRSLIAQLRREPLPVDMWATMPQLVRPALVVLASFVAAIGVALTR